MRVALLKASDDVNQLEQGIGNFATPAVERDIERHHSREGIGDVPRGSIESPCG